MTALIWAGSAVLPAVQAPIVVAVARCVAPQADVFSRHTGRRCKPHRSVEWAIRKRIAERQATT